MAKKTVLVTGCSEGGLGAALARAFQQQGFHVFATVRNPAKAAPLASDDIEVLPLEVTSKESALQCAEEVKAKTGGTLDVLVNNAGSMFMMPLLDTSIEESKKLYDVNVWGVLAVTQAFAPLLVRSKGVVLNICSIAGAIRLAWQGKSLVCLCFASGSFDMSPFKVLTSVRNLQQFKGCRDMDF